VDFRQDCVALSLQAIDHPVSGEKWVLGFDFHEMPPENREYTEAEPVFFDDQGIPAGACGGKIGGSADKSQILYLVLESLLIPHVVPECDRVHAVPTDGLGDGAVDPGAARRILSVGHHQIDLPGSNGIGQEALEALSSGLSHDVSDEQYAFTHDKGYSGFESRIPKTA